VSEVGALCELRPEFGPTREGLHRVAAELVAPARKPQNEIALTPAPGGFGTPPFEFEGVATRVRVEGVDLVLERGPAERRARLESVAVGAALLGAELLPDGMPDDDSALGLDPAAAEALADWFALGARVLGGLRVSLAAADGATEPILWPEHFDVAIEAGDEAAGTRATYGASPGDENHPEPYLYVAPWAKREGAPWNATGFDGAELGYGDLAAAEDASAVALEFYEAHRQSLG
jgi:hypothetical protein